jgi:AICAR transformylase/IMP cyclohydrolase PurH
VRQFPPGTGQTSRVDALMQAIEKAKNFEFKRSRYGKRCFFPFQIV